MSIEVRSIPKDESASIEPIQPVMPEFGIPPTSEYVISEHRVLGQVLAMDQQVLVATTQRRISECQAADQAGLTKELDAREAADATLRHAEAVRDEAIRAAHAAYKEAEELHGAETRRIDYHEKARNKETEALLRVVQTVYDSGEMSLKRITEHSRDIIRVLEIIDRRYQDLLGAQRHNVQDRARQVEAWGQLNDERDRVTQEQATRLEARAALKAESDRIFLESSAVTDQAHEQLDKAALLVSPDEDTINAIFNEQGQLTYSQAEALGRIARLDGQETMLNKEIDRYAIQIRTLEASIADRVSVIDGHDAITERIQAAKMALEEHRQGLIRRQEALREVLKQWSGIVDKDVSELVNVSSIVSDFLERTEELEKVTGPKKVSVSIADLINNPDALPVRSSVPDIHIVYEGLGNTFGGPVALKDLPDLDAILGLADSEERQEGVDSWADSVQSEIDDAVKTLTTKSLDGLAGRLASAVTKTIAAVSNGRHSS